MSLLNESHVQLHVYILLAAAVNPDCVDMIQSQVTLNVSQIQSIRSLFIHF
jgi:hypothetical protein